MQPAHDHFHVVLFSLELDYNVWLFSGMTSLQDLGIKLLFPVKIISGSAAFFLGGVVYFIISIQIFISLLIACPPF